MRKNYRQSKKYLFIKLCTLVFLLFSTSYIYSQAKAQTLEKAYKENSTEKLKEFFYAWNQDTPPTTDIKLSKYNHTIQQAYKAFIAFYKPHRLDSIAGKWRGDDIYKNVDFLIVQNTLKIYFADNLFYNDQEVEEYVINQSSFPDSIQAKWLGKRNDNRNFDFIFDDIESYIMENRKLKYSIKNFRPAIHQNGKIPLFLTKKYDKIITAFLGNNHLPLGAGESEKRKNFLENCIKTFYIHWGGYWQLKSYPEAYSITFDKNMKYAIIDFRLVYRGGVAFLKNEGGVWTLISSRLTWIE